MRALPVGQKMRADYYPDATPTPWSDVPEPTWSRCSGKFNKFASQIGFQAAKDSYNAELKGIYDAGCVGHVELPNNAFTLGSEMLYKEKANGTAKGRGIIKGQNQVADRDYTAHKAPSPTASALVVFSIDFSMWILHVPASRRENKA